MRNLQVKALIDHAKSDLQKIRVQYDKSLEETVIPSSLQIDIKNYMENLRSALDYMAHDIYEKKITPYRITNSKPEIKSVYFPYGSSEADFLSSIGRSLPDLRIVAPDLYKILEDVQFHKINDNWLTDFCRILNEKKHNTLTPQKKEEKRSLEINFGGGASIQMGPGASISGSGFIGTGQGGITLHGDTISGDSPAIRTSGNVSQIIIRWIYFKFDDTNLEVYPLLTKALEGIQGLYSKIYNLLP